MNICLKTCSRYPDAQQVDIQLSERLPFYIVSDCKVHCDYFVKSFPGYYTLTLDVSGILPIHCQRCLDEFKHHYVNHTELAICRDDTIAEQLMDEYECIVSDQLEIDLHEIITDELHLYVPEKHTDLIDCHSEITSMIGNNE